MAQRLILPINRCIISAGYKNAAYKKQQGYAHYGADLYSEIGDTAVYACGSGTVIAAGMDGSALNKRLGNCIVIVYRDVELPGGKVCDIACRMFHFGKISVKPGDKVTKNTVIGHYGNTGSTLVNGKPMGCHLHLELDTDAKYPQYAVGISGSGNVIKRGTADSTVNPSAVWYLDSNQSIKGRYEGWYTKQDVELPRVTAEPQPPVECKNCAALTSQISRLKLERSALQTRLDKIAMLAANE